MRSIEEEEEEEDEGEDEAERKSMDGKLSTAGLPLSFSFSHLSLLSRGGAGGGVAGRGGAILLGNRGGHAPGSRGVVVYADTATSCHSEEEAGQVHRDAEEQEQTANQRRAGNLH